MTAARPSGSSSSKAPAKKSGAAPKGKLRIHLLDELRGFAIFCMVFYHAFFTVGYFFNIHWGYVLVNFFMPAEPYFAGLFILISGIACNLSHSNLRRGVKLALIALAVSLITFWALGDKDMIRFGILHMLAVGMILFGLIGKYLRLIPVWVGVAVNLVLFFLTYQINDRVFGLPFLFSVRMPDSWYSTQYLFMFGFPANGFSSSDYFPLMPWLFLFFVGAFLGRESVRKKYPKFAYKRHIPFFSFLGKHSLLIYLVHQPVIFGLCYAVEWFRGIWRVVGSVWSAVFF